jgi:hypothetical protein
MKIILSRKGFDSSNGGHASPILPDNTLLSLPIPIKKDMDRYCDLSHQGSSYLSIIQQLRRRTEFTEEDTCHLDPDIRKSVKERPNNWRSIFGQCDGAQTHLKNNKVGVGDLFLFFGWFKQTKYIGNSLKYVPGSRDLHIIYGYLQVGEIYKCGDTFPEYTHHHTHTRTENENKTTNCIYVAADRLSFNNHLPGFGCFKFNQKLVLTKAGMTRGKWELPDFFRGLSISHHFQHSWVDDYFKSVDIGQEFVIEENEQVSNWAQQLIENYIDLAACR